MKTRPTAQAPIAWSSDTGGVVIDERLAPVIIGTWYGTSTIEMIDQYFDWNDTFMGWALRRNRPLVMISDVLDAERPNASIRRHIADRTEAQRSDARDALVIGNFVAVRSAAVRGALTAISWFSSRPSTMMPVKDLETAFARAREVLEAHAIAAPPGLNVVDYERPVPHEYIRSAG